MMLGKSSCAYLALVLLLVGIQAATSKSVDELFKDERYNERLSSLTKRAATEATTAASDSGDEEVDADASEKDATPIWVITTPKPSAPTKRRRQTARPSTSTTPVPSTTEEQAEEETEEEDGEASEGRAAEPEDKKPQNEDVATVKPLTNGKRPKPRVPKNKPKSTTTTTAPQLASRIDGEEDEEEEEMAGEEVDNKDDATPKPKPKPQPKQPQQPQPQQPPSVLPNNLLPPMPYYYPPYYGAGLPANPAFSSPWALGAAPYHYPNPTGPAFSDSGSGFASASASAGGQGGGTITATSTFPGGMGQTATSFSNTYPAGAGEPGSFIHTRGSFGGAGDDDSVAIEVNGPPAAAGVPHYAAQPSIYPSSAPAGGLGYQSAASSSYAGSGAGGASPFAANPYNVGFAGAASQQDLFQQYFAALRAQHEAFQRQLQAQILSQQQAIWDQSNRLDSNFGNSGDSNGEPVSAFGAVSLGPQGGYQAAQISPAAPGIFSRFGESVPPPSGNVYGVFSSSSSSSQTGPDGKTVSRKTSTVGVNDNGKISVKTVHDP